MLEDVGLLLRELEEGPEYFKTQTGSEKARIIRRQFRANCHGRIGATMTHLGSRVHGGRKRGDRWPAARS